jgi:hypothetical protein
MNIETHQWYENSKVLFHQMHLGASHVVDGPDKINLLNHSDCWMHHCFNVHILYTFFHREYLCVSCNSDNKQRLFPQTVFSSYWRCTVLPVSYEMNFKVLVSLRRTLCSKVTANDFRSMWRSSAHLQIFLLIFYSLCIHPFLSALSLFLSLFYIVSPCHSCSCDPFIFKILTKARESTLL